MNGVFVLRAGSYLSIPVSRRLLIVMPCLMLALLVSLYATLIIGRTAISFGDVVQALFAQAETLSREARTIANFRVPRALVAILAGAMMAASGFLLQIISRNGLADPGILGLSDGAAVAVVVASTMWGVVDASLLSLIALGGALATALLVLTLGRRLVSGGGIILIGLSIGIVLGAIVEVVLAAGTASQFATLMVWSRGTLEAVDENDLRLLARWSLVLFPMVLLASRMMRPLLLGDEAAAALGVPVRVATIIFVLLATGLAAPVVAVCGPIAFVGLMSSYIARSLVGERPTEILCVAVLVGGLILLWADTLGRSLFSPITVSAGIMVSVVGALTFIIAARARGRIDPA